MNRLHTDGLIAGTSGDDALYGTETNDSIYGYGGKDTLSGLADSDLLDGGPGDDLLYGDGGKDQLFGRDGNDTLDGGADDDTLDGGAGRDSMLGGVGDDVFYVDYDSGPADMDEVVESAGEGHDRVLSTISYTLPANVEVLRLKGDADIDGTGNALANRIDGNAGNNHLVGGGGDDSMWGGRGIDSMEGGAGDDTYYVDDIADGTYEAPPVALSLRDPHEAGGGSNIDTVISQVSFTLRANVEQLLLEGAKDLHGTGNELNNLMSGNAGDNLLSGRDGVDILGGGLGNDTLDGGAGADTLGGGEGDDVYVVDNAKDVLVPESSLLDFDTVKASLNWTLESNIEKLVLTGAALAGSGNPQANTLNGNGNSNVLNGLAGDDTLLGFAGADRLSGGLGRDTMTGGANADKFVFDSAPGTQNADEITDFASGADRIHLDDDAFTQFDASASTALLAGQFFKSASATAAHDEDDRIVYNTSTGALFYDADGTGPGAATEIATLTGAPALSAADFLVVT